MLKRWRYLPNEEQLEGYRRLFADFYDEECQRLFSAAVLLNRKAEYRDRLKGCYVNEGELAGVLRHWQAAEGKVVIYGIGNYGQAFLRYARVANLPVDALVVTDGENIHSVPGCDLPIHELCKLPYAPDECTVIIAIQAAQARRLVEKELRYRGYFRIL